MATNATEKAKKAGRPKGTKVRKAARKLTAWDKQAMLVKRLTLAAKKAQDKLRDATAKLKEMPTGK
jgi:hypothetical protein